MKKVKFGNPAVRGLLWVIVGLQAACGTAPNTVNDSPVIVADSATAAAPVSGRGSSPAIAVQGAQKGMPPSTQNTAAMPPTEAGIVLQAKSRWVAVQWAELPGFQDDALHEAWNAWIKSCERPSPKFAPLCPEIRRLSIAAGDAQRAWMGQNLQPYRVETLDGKAEGMLTGYYEPMLPAARQLGNGYSVPLYSLPSMSKRPWFSRQEIDTAPQAIAALKGKAIAYLADPVDALVLQIQGSGRLRVTEADGSQRTVRLAFAGTNEQPYKSVGRWLLDAGEIKDASWPGIKAWVVRNPQRVQEMLWSNPRVTFFKEEPLVDMDSSLGPKGAQGVPLTPGRSIAVDRQSIPYGTPVWMQSKGEAADLQKLVMAQDTGSAIVGAVRADYFAGWGPEAGDVAGRLKQSLKLWVLWPK